MGKLRQDITTLTMPVPGAGLPSEGWPQGPRPQARLAWRKARWATPPGRLGLFLPPGSWREPRQQHGGLSPKLHWLGEDLAP